jgi:hypothetical protein
MAGLFDKPGLLFGVWGVCVLTQVGAHYKIPLPMWWVILTFFGAVVPVFGLILAVFS